MTETGPRWFQLYWPNDPDVSAAILGRARKAGYPALVVTLDTWTLAWRPRDLDQAYLPFIRNEGTAIPCRTPRSGPCWTRHRKRICCRRSSSVLADLDLTLGLFGYRTRQLTPDALRRG